MTGLRSLHEIETQCHVVRQNHSECGGLSVVLLCGDFYQLPPIHDRTLWQHVFDPEMQLIMSKQVMGVFW